MRPYRLPANHMVTKTYFVINRFYDIVITCGMELIPNIPLRL